MVINRGSIGPRQDPDKRQGLDGGAATPPLEESRGTAAATFAEVDMAVGRSLIDRQIHQGTGCNVGPAACFTCNGNARRVAGPAACFTCNGRCPAGGWAGRLFHVQRAVHGGWLGRPLPTAPGRGG